MTLSQLKPGQTAVIKTILRDDEYMSRLMELGLIEGEKVTLIKRAPLGDPVEIHILSYNLSIRLTEAESIEIVTE